MDFWKVALAGVGGFLVWEYLKGQGVSLPGAGSGVAPSGAVTTNPSPVVQQTGNPLLVAMQKINAGDILNAAIQQGESSPSKTVSQWNYFFNKVTGTQLGPALGDHGQVIDLATYWNALSSFAQSGNSGLSGVVNTTGPDVPWGCGDDEFLQALGRGAAALYD